MVRLLYDEIGCLRLSNRYLNRLRDGGVDVRLLIPSMADEWAVYLAGFYYERELA